MLKINNLTVEINNKTILNDFNMEINDGEIHAVMGKNGIGKSTLSKVIVSDPNYTIKGGMIIYNNENITGLLTSEIAKKGIMYIAQNPMAIEGVSNAELLRCALNEKDGKKVNIFEFNKELEKACSDINLDPKFIHKDVNVGASGGERKKIELLHMALLKPELIILDELDSGLDVEALKDVSNFINEYHKNNKCTILIITHHINILELIKPNYVHVMEDGKIVKTGDYKLAMEIEKNGFGANVID